MCIKMPIFVQTLVANLSLSHGRGLSNYEECLVDLLPLLFDVIGINIPSV